MKNNKTNKIENTLLKVDKVNKNMIAEEEKVDIKNEFSMELIVKNVNNLGNLYYSNSLIVAFYKQKDAADYLGKTEDFVLQLKQAGILKHAVLFPDGEVIYSIDELDNIGMIIDKTETDLWDQENNKNE